MIARRWKQYWTRTDTPRFHRWVQTASNIIQALALAIGVAFGIIEISARHEERHQHQVEITLDKIRELGKDPVQPAFNFAVQAGDKLGTGTALNEFMERSAPYRTFVADLATCVSTDICDRELAIAKVCPTLDRYLDAESKTTDFHNGAGHESDPTYVVKFVSVLVLHFQLPADVGLMAAICDGDPRFAGIAQQPNALGYGTLKLELRKHFEPPSGYPQGR